MEPTIGRIVIVKGAIRSNGSDEHPAIINAVHNPHSYPDRGQAGYINAMVFPDGGVPACVTRLHFFDSRKDAAKSGHERVAFWPDRL